MSTTDQLLDNARTYADEFDKGDLPLPPARKVAVVACMDARLDPQKVLGLAEGDGHVIRNAGGVVTDDAIRSLAISQRLLGTEEIILIHHTDCGMVTFSDDEFRRGIQEEIGVKPQWAAEAFPDAEEDVRQSLGRIQASPFIPRKTSVRGFLYHVEDGSLQEVS
jgi:carbonic anhydrase